MMSVPELESLFRKDKRSIAVALLKEYKNGDPGESKLIHKFMSEYLTVKKSLTDMDMIETIKWIISSGMTFDEYSKEVKKYDTATACGLVWIYNFIAYRCRTCAISPCMSLCADCFNKGDHEGHDFNMFKSLAGGACDCGDESVLKSSGFCSTHRQRPDTTLPVAPPKLLFLAKETVPYLLNRLLWELRQPKFEACIGADFFIDNVFNPLTEMGAQMRRLISEAMIDTSSYSSLAHDVDSDHLVIKNILNDRKKNYLAIKSRMQKTLRPELTFYKDQEFFANAMKRAFDKDLDHNCFVDELLFWTIYHEFPEKLVCFLLKMLPEANYRKRIAESFADHYSRLTSMLASCRGTDDENKQFYTDSLSSCVVHVSVQLFSNEPIALGLCENHHLLQIVVGSLRAIFEGHRNFDQDSTTVLVPSQLHTKSKENRHMVINCEHPIMKTHVFWPVVSDLTNLLVHTPIALMFMDSTELLDLWLQFMMHFQGMDVNTRELVNHVEFEGDSYHSAFAAEIEICATPLWTLISHLKDESTAELTRKMIKFSQKYLEEWFTLINFANSDVPDPLQATFHLPLHRYYSIFLHQGVQYQGLSLKELLPPPHLLKAYLAHPLQVQVDFYEIWAGLWVRNGHQMKAQAMTYVGCHYCNSMVDADLFLIQQIAANLDPDWFIQTVLERFHIWEWFSLDYNPSQASDSNSIAPDQTMSILEGALVFLATIFSVNTNLGASEKDVLRKEMVTLLAVGDRTHSQLTSFLPERCGTCHNIGLESILKDIADFREPTLESSGSLSQGMFFPKSKIWEEEYDPIYALLRAVHRRDFQFSLDRFTQHVRSTSKLENNSQALLWPPYRIPKNLDTSKFLDARKVLYSKVLHGAIFMILYKAVYSNNITEQVLSLIIYILELSLRFPVPDNDSPMLKLDGQPTYKNGVPDLNFEDWFDSNSIIENMNTAIQSVNVFQQRLGTIVDIDEETGPSIEEMDVDMYMSGSESDDIEEDVVWVHSDENLDDPQCTNSPFNRSPHPTLQPSTSQPSLPSRAGMLALTEPVPTGASSTSTALVPSISMDISPHSSVAEDNPHPDHPTSNSSSYSLCSFIYSSSNNESSSSSSSSSTSSSSTSSSSSSSSSNQNPVPMNPSSLNTAKTSESHPSSALLPRPNPKAHRRMIRFFNNLRRRSIDRRVQYNRTLDQMNQVTDMMRALPSSASPYVEVFPVNESIISLLLKLHSKLKGKSNSYVPSRTVSESRIGDGAHFIEIVLNLYCNSNVSSGLQSINEWKEKIWPSEPREESSTSNQEKEECSGSSQIDKDEKRRKAKERQQKLMAEFASKQKAFIKKMEAMKHSDEENLKESDIPPSGSYASSFLQAATYECIICGQSGSSTAEELVGMVVLLQPTNVWGHSIIRSMNEKVNDHRVLPCSQEEEISGQRVDNTLKCYMSKRIDDLVSVFDSPSWHFSMNIGWEGGVHVQSCGHFIHLECHKRYIQSLRDSQASNRFNVEGEFFCPLCRQLANSILPINPDIDSNGAVVKCRLNEPQELGIEIMNLLNNIGTSDKDLMQKFITFCEDLTKATPAHYRSPRISPSTDTLLSFFCSVLRTNLECELITILSQSNPTGVKKSCFVSLFHVLALQARSLVLIKQLTPRFPCLWSQLTGIPIPEELSLSIAVREEEVPLLLQDTVSTLILLFSVLPLNVEKSYFSSVTQVLYNLTLIQGLAQITLFRPKDDYSSIPSSFTSLFGLLKYVHASFDNINCQTDRSTKLASLAQFFISHGYESELGQDKITEETSENLAKKLCLPFMRIAALLQSHLYNEPFPKNIVNEKSEEFVTLANFLGLQADGIPIWMIDDPSSLIGTWITDFSVLFPQNIIIARSLLQKRPVDIYRPSLLRLPSTYNHIFLYYHRKCCKTCNKIAREPCICLVCGTLVCFKDECCRYSSTGKYEAIAHADWCGAGTTIYLSVNSSCIIVIRGKRACYWGSVYLDSYGEEDNDLKRGKPLYLCKKRYAALEQQWLTHSFDHTNKRWILHKENL